MAEKNKILFLAANPSDAGWARLDREAKQIKQRLERSRYRNSFEFITEFAVGIGDIDRALMEHRPHIIHFSGHGNKKRGILIEDLTGNSWLINGKAFADIIRALGINVRMVVLNACYAADQVDPISEIVDFTIGMSKPIRDDAAIAFSISFYQALSNGESVQAAFDLGRNQLGAKRDLPMLRTREGANSSEPLVKEHENRDGVARPASDDVPERPGMAESMQSPGGILNAAIRAVPAVKFALGVAGIAAVVAIIKSWQINLRVGFAAVAVMICLMAVLFVLNEIIKDTIPQIYKHVLISFSLLFFMSTCFCIFTSVFINWPIDPRTLFRTPTETTGTDDKGIPPKTETREANANNINGSPKPPPRNPFGPGAGSNSGNDNTNRNPPPLNPSWREIDTYVRSTYPTGTDIDKVQSLRDPDPQCPNGCVQRVRIVFRSGSRPADTGTVTYPHFGKGAWSFKRD